MLIPQFITANEAVRLIKNGDTIANVSMTMLGVAESIYREIERSFLEENRPEGLTLLHPSGFSDREGGIEHLAHYGLINKIIGSHWGLAPKIMDMIFNNKLEAYCYPLGILTNIFHSMSGKEAGKISKIGLGTFIDPRFDGGRMNIISKDELIELITINGEEYLLYKHIPIDVLIIRGTYADETGNISAIDEGCVLEILPAALATKRYGGKVIVQVRQLVRKGSIPPKEVVVPGVFVDAVVICEHPFEEHRQTSSWFQDDTCSGQLQSPAISFSNLEPSERKIIGRRASMQLHLDSLINIGTGIPTDTIGSILSEEGITEDNIMITVETGVYGGVPVGGRDFGISRNPVALIPENMQFDVYQGRGVDFTFMGSGEIDAKGNINSTKMGRIVPGSGGFIDITTMAKNVVFCSTFTGKGLKVTYDEENGLVILQEGCIKKFVKNVTQISYSSARNIPNGQNAWYITERAVFQLTASGPLLIEIAKGIDLQKNILDQMDFLPLIANPLKQIDTLIYRNGSFGLKNILATNQK